MQSRRGQMELLIKAFHEFVFLLRSASFECIYSVVTLRDIFLKWNNNKMDCLFDQAVVASNKGMSTSTSNNH